MGVFDLGNSCAELMAGQVVPKILRRSPPLGAAARGVNGKYGQFGAAEPLRIVHLITGLEAGGAERMLTRVATGSDRDRFRSLVISMTAGGSMEEILRRAGIRTETLGMPRGQADPRGIIRLLRILRAWRPHLLQSWLYHADFFGLSARLLGRRPGLLWNIRCTESVGSAAIRRVLSSCSAIPDAVVVNSVAGQQFHQERLGYRPKRWECIPNGFDTRELRPNEVARRRLRGELGIAETSTVIGMAARYHPMKDHTNFLAAATELAQRRGDVMFVLAGSGITPDNRKIGAAIGKYGLTQRVRLLGERLDIGAVYPGFDIATLSSAFGEGCPNALGEAMACGVPCVATDSGDSAQLLGDTGLVVPRRSPAALARAWERFVEMPSDERRAFGRRARERIVCEYDIDIIIRRYEALYAEIVSENDGAALDSQEEHINIGTGEDLSIRDLAQLVCDVVGFRGEVESDSSKPDGTPLKCSDVSRLRGLGWSATIDLRTGLERTYRWFLENAGDLRPRSAS